MDARCSGVFERTFTHTTKKVAPFNAPEARENPEPASRGHHGIWTKYEEEEKLSEWEMQLEAQARAANQSAFPASRRNRKTEV